MHTVTTPDRAIETDLRDDHRSNVVGPTTDAPPASPTPARAAGSEDPVPPSRRRRITFGSMALWFLTIVLLVVLFLPALLGFSRYAIVGSSMQGTYDKYSAVFEKPVPVSELQVGDVITYRPPAEAGIATLVTHRIVAIQRTQDGRPLFQTKGDANPVADPWKFTLDRPVQNVVRFAVPGVGWVLIKLSDPHVRRLAIAVPAGLIGLGAVAELLGISVSRRRRPVSQV